MNEETTLLRAGRHREAGDLTRRKDPAGAGLCRAIRAPCSASSTGSKPRRPADIGLLQAGHERLATQMAENLKVIATARAVTEDLLTDVARQVGSTARPRTYGAGGVIAPPTPTTGGLAINRAL